MLKIILMLFLVLIPVWCEADTHTAASCSYADVNTALTAASDGDTVQIPNGTCTWTNQTLNVTKAVTIKGNGFYAISGSGDPRTDEGTWPLTINMAGYSGGAWSNISAIYLNVSSGSLVRITGIYFTGSASVNYQYPNGAIIIERTNNTPYRIDNCKFRHDYNSIVPKRCDLGLIDHCFFNSWTCSSGWETQTRITLFDHRGSATGSGGSCAYGNTYDYWGHWASSEATTWGGSNFLFIEDNCFIYSCWNVGNAQAMIDNAAAGKAVIRYNYMYTPLIVWHGTGSGGMGRGGIAFEIYNNILMGPHDGSPEQALIGARGGTALIYNNTADYMQNFVDVRMERREVGFGQDCSDNCTGTSCDGNYCCCDGTHAWDGNTTPSGYPCLDQVGWIGSPGTFENSQPQTLKPLRIWNNTLTDNSGSIVHHVNPTATAGYVVENREYYSCADSSCAQSGYTAYTYPHPLQGSIPSSVQGLTIQGGTLK